MFAVVSVLSTGHHAAQASPAVTDRLCKAQHPDHCNSGIGTHNCAGKTSRYGSRMYVDM